MKIETLVAGVDFSEASVRAAHWTARHFAPLSRLVLVHVAEEETSDNAAARLDALRASLDGAQTTAVVRTGRIAEALAAAVREFSADLLVVGAHQEAGRLRDALGSTAERMLHTCTAPVLLARGTREHAPRRILVPIEDAALTGHVLTWAAALARRFTARTTLLHAITPQVPGRVRLVSGSAASREFDERMLASAEAWLAQGMVRGGFEPDRTERLVVEGDARTAVLDGAVRTDADLIVMGSRGAGTAGQLILGSVARDVLRRARCPVLVVTDRDRAHLT